jgi:hypothetical protein
MKFLLAFALVFAGGGAAAQSARLPDRLSDAEFWFLSAMLSEAPGQFASENYVSNEGQFQRVLARFDGISPASRDVYLGVGPEQNFTYIAAQRARFAFIVDIRRGNLLEHLLYKALFALSDDRAEFTSRLFSLPAVALPAAVSVDSLVESFWTRSADTALFSRNRRDVFDFFRRHDFRLTAADSTQIVAVYTVFFRAGPGLSYSYPRDGVRSEPAYHELMRATDSTGAQRHFLASDSAFRYVKDLQERNLIVPVVGDFAGAKSLREIARWLKERDARVGAFYVSNVEQYLFQSEDDRWRRFYGNVEALPVDSTSLFVRSIAFGDSLILVRTVNPVRYDSDTVIGNGGRVILSGPIRMMRRETVPGFGTFTSGIRATLDAIPNGWLMIHDDLRRISR